LHLIESRHSHVLMRRHRAASVKFSSSPAGPRVRGAHLSAKPASRPPL